MHLAVYRFVYNTLAEYGLPKTVVEFGGRNLNGSVRDIFPNALYVSVDSVAGNGVDVVADAADYHHPTLVECVVCTEVLEHTPRAEEVVRNAIRTLKTGGLLILTCAGPGRKPHGSETADLQPGEYYGAISPDVLATWFEGAFMGAVQYDPDRGDIFAWAMRGN